MHILGLWHWYISTDTKNAKNARTRNVLTESETYVKLDGRMSWFWAYTERLSRHFENMRLVYNKLTVMFPKNARCQSRYKNICWFVFVFFFKSSVFWWFSIPSKNMHFLKYTLKLHIFGSDAGRVGRPDVLLGTRSTYDSFVARPNHKILCASVSLRYVYMRERREIRLRDINKEAITLVSKSSLALISMLMAFLLLKLKCAYTFL